MWAVPLPPPSHLTRLSGLCVLAEALMLCWWPHAICSQSPGPTWTVVSSQFIFNFLRINYLYPRKMAQICRCHFIHVSFSEDVRTVNEMSLTYNCETVYVLIYYTNSPEYSFIDFICNFFYWIINQCWIPNNRHSMLMPGSTLCTFIVIKSVFPQHRTGSGNVHTCLI